MSEGLTPKIGGARGGAIGEVHPTNHRTHACADNSTDGQIRFIEGLENAEVRKAARTTAAKGEHRRSQPPRRSYGLFLEIRHGTPPLFQLFVERLAPRDGAFAADFVAAFGFGFAFTFLGGDDFLALPFVPRAGPGLAFFLGFGFTVPDFFRVLGRRRSISAISPRRAS
jgi:hypothetical protein